MREHDYYTSARAISKKSKKHGIAWYAELSYKDGKGQWKKIQRALPGAEGKREANRQAEDLRIELNKQWRYTSETVRSLLDDFLDDLIAAKRLGLSTINRYRREKHYIEQRFGDIRVTDIHESDLERWRNELSQNLAPRTVNGTLSFFKRALERAKNRGDIPRNPMSGIRSLQVSKTEPNRLPEEEWRRLLTYLDAHLSMRTNLGIKIAMLTGMREAEICALQWCHVNLGDSPYISVELTLGRDDSAGYEHYYVKEPKSEAGKRQIPIPRELAANLSDRKAQMQKQCADAGIAFTEELYALGDVDGAFYRPKLLWRAWCRRQKSLNIQGTRRTPTFHDLRHTYISQMIDGGIDIKTVSSLAGHSDVAMTLNVYAASNEDSKRDAVSRVMDAKLEGTLSHRDPDTSVENHG